MTKSRVAFLGIGLMGSRQARRLLEAQYPLTAWNRSRQKAEALASFGATIASTAAEAVQGADIVFTMLENAPVVEDVLFSQGVADALQPTSVVVDMSSIKPEEAQAHAARLAGRNVEHVDAPVSGGVGGAEHGTLAIMAGGKPQVFTRIEPLLRVMGRPLHIGPHGAGQLAKLANQIIVGATIGAVAEALLLARRGGADPAKVRQALRGGFADSRILELHGQRMVERDFTTRGRTAMQVKDLDNALDAAARLGMSATPYTSLTANLFRDLLEHAGDLDHSGLLLELERLNGDQEARPDDGVG
jgi:3-hydroxyisobutyrate dehydrogenase-like beta-hydroxyacid dehydrogenase